MDGEDILDEDRTMTIDNASNSLGIHSLGTTTLLVVVIVFFFAETWMVDGYCIYVIHLHDDHDIYSKGTVSRTLLGLE